MFKALFNGIINLLATILQVIVWPINQVIEATLPDISEQIVSVTSTFTSVFDCLGWAVGLIPTPIQIVLIFIITCEIAKHTIFTSTHTLIKVWNVLQKIKFW